ncbi:MAG: metallophosphoesterase [Burkholderiaceae bacterium]
MSGKTFKIWASGCAHVVADKHNGRESLADAIRQAERDFDWDVGVNLGDFSAAFGLPTDEEGLEIVRQFAALAKHRREDIYTICGNHDRNAPDEPAGQWFCKYIDPLGDNPMTSGVRKSRFRHVPVGSFERYYVDIGNVRLLMMSDVNETSQAKGRGELGGNPGGVVSRDTFDWWVDQVNSHHSDKIIITAHHYVLRETTVASGDWEGMKRNASGQWTTDYHGYYAEGNPQAASYLYWVAGKAGAGQFEKWLNDNPGKVDFWLGAHTHTNPDDMRGGKSHIEKRYGGTTFVNVAALTRWFVKDHAMPHSRLFTFEDGSADATIDCYMHTDEYRPQGFYPEKQSVVRLTKPFRLDGSGAVCDGSVA